jgi:anti-sigma B factor antagonist
VSSGTTAAVELQDDGERVLAVVHGELDLASVPAIQEEIDGALSGGARRLVVDLTDVVFLDSTAAALLFRLAAQSRDRRRELVVVAPEGGRPRRVIDLVGLATVASVVDGPPEA